MRSIAEMRMRSSQVRGCDLADEWLGRLTANAKVATVLGSSIPTASDTVEPEVRQMKQC
jgi:hypothetical protein